MQISGLLSLPISTCALLVMLTFAGCVVNPVTGDPNFVTMSEAQAINTGRAEDKKVHEQCGSYDDPALQRYVNDIGQRLAKASHCAGLQYQFLVVASPEVNAFALPGGYTYITRGILAYLNSEAELAAAFSRYRSAMDAAMNSFHALTEQERARAMPLRVRVITARAGLTFAELARSSPLGRFAEGHLRVINDLYPTGAPIAGQSLKIVE